MRRVLAVAAVPVLAAALAGCGGGGTSGGGAKQRARPTLQSSGSDCDLKQITAGARREGRCVARGVQITVANRTHWLHGKDYDARILGARTLRSLAAARGRRLAANGRFVVVRLAIRNTLDAPHLFDRASNLAFLLIDHKYFGESPAPEAIRSLGPFRLRKAAIQPDEVATGAIVFDVPTGHARHLTARGGNLILVDFGDEAKGFPTGTEPLVALGYIRLWK
jgi:hypothetical protein